MRHIVFVFLALAVTGWASLAGAQGPPPGPPPPEVSHCWGIGGVTWQMLDQGFTGEGTVGTSYEPGRVGAWAEADVSYSVGEKYCEATVNAYGLIPIAKANDRCPDLEVLSSAQGGAHWGISLQITDAPGGECWADSDLRSHLVAPGEESQGTRLYAPDVPRQTLIGPGLQLGPFDDETWSLSATSTFSGNGNVKLYLFVASYAYAKNPDGGTTVVHAEANTWDWANAFSVTGQ